MAVGNMLNLVYNAADSSPAFIMTAGGEVGCWYTFFTPQDVQRVETGHILCGIRAQPGLAVRYRLVEEREGTETRNQVETIYLAFDDLDALQRVLDDLSLDVAPSASEGLPTESSQYLGGSPSHRHCT